ncbi:hypothetical protein PspLS_02912 [Pyricularia sp. CBS 133598]|nr:hypothetical protein PspLS_02912 [Pyricularia sp. CBS 133598]
MAVCNRHAATTTTGHHHHPWWVFLTSRCCGCRVRLA